MTIIEFFDGTFVGNICACLVNPPERVILIGEQKKKILDRQAEIYEDILYDHGYDVIFDTRTVNKNNMGEILSVLSEIVESVDNCVFDLTGGDNAFLVAAGIIFERYREKNLQMHRFNIRNGTVQDCDLDGETMFEAGLPALTVDENIRIYGGDVIYENVVPNTTPLWHFDEGLADDINIMWEICRADPKSWNVQCDVLAAAEQLKRAGGKDPLTVTVPLPLLRDRMADIGVDVLFNENVLGDLRRAGLIDIQRDEERVLITYKNRQIKKCLIKAGQALEMKIYLTALTACEPNGSYTYHDVINGIHIDWDGEIPVEGTDHGAKNEIDVMMMHGMVPVFVSCKNGVFEMDELYKLHTVATKFGGKYAKKVLIPAYIDEKSKFGRYLNERAGDMGIRILWRIVEKSDAELERIIKSLWCN